MARRGLPLLPHAAHIELGIARRHLKQTGGLRAFSNIAQLEAARAFVGLYDAAQFRIHPHMILLALVGDALVFDGASSVQSLAANLRAAAPVLVSARLFRGFLPTRAGIVYVLYAPV